MDSGCITAYILVIMYIDTLFNKTKIRFFMNSKFTILDTTDRSWRYIK